MEKVRKTLIGTMGILIVTFLIVISYNALSPILLYRTALAEANTMLKRKMGDECFKNNFALRSVTKINTSNYTVLYTLLPLATVLNEADEAIISVDVDHDNAVLKAGGIRAESFCTRFPEKLPVVHEDEAVRIATKNGLDMTGKFYMSIDYGLNCTIDKHGWCWTILIDPPKEHIDFGCMKLEYEIDAITGVFRTIGGRYYCDD